MRARMTLPMPMQHAIGTGPWAKPLPKDQRLDVPRCCMQGAKATKARHLGAGWRGGGWARLLLLLLSGRGREGLRP